MRLNCGKITGSGCHFVAEGRTGSQARKEFFRHAQHSHDYLLRNFTASDFLRIKRKAEEQLS